MANLLQLQIYFSLIFLLSPFFSSILLSAAKHHRCLNSQKSVLMQMKHDILCNSSNFDEHYTVKIKQWNSRSNCCSWTGITCDIAGHVVGLDLSYEYLSGNSSAILYHYLPQLRFLSTTLTLDYNNLFSMPLNFLSNYSHLEFLSLYECELQGNFPENIFLLPKLRYIDLLNNEFLTGQLPEFSSNSSLEYLDLSNTGFYGRIPNSISNLKLLKHLDLFINNFSGMIPHSLSNLSQIINLYLGFNQFSGSIPLFQSHNVPKLAILDLQYNQFNGFIHSSLFNLPSLRDLYMAGNQFEGQVEEFGNASSSVLENLYLSQNNLIGPIPRGIFELPRLISLTLSNSGLSFRYHNSRNLSSPNFQMFFCSSCEITKFPDFLMFQNQLTDLDLSYNKIGGKVPSWLWGKEKLNYLNISYNCLDAFDQIHPNVSSTSLLSLDLQANKLQDSFPISICNLSYLNFLDASQNHLSGSILECFGKLNSLSVLNLDWNDFHHMPLNFTLMTSLISLKINGNQLEGKLPRSLIGCTKLETLDLGNNRIYDTFPFWLEKLPQLKVLVLRGNNFYGPIDDHNVKFVLPNLSIMDLSWNNFTGELSKEFFQSLKAMMKINETNSQPTYIEQALRVSNFSYFDYTESVIIIEKGAEMELKQILTTLITLDLSNNRLQGEIPKEIGDLKLLKEINLSGNGFTNKIPSSLANLTELESLDLSRNMLSGTIPPQLSSLTFLSMMNLSYNHLEGRIPEGNQFNTFNNDSYLGNPNLCGVPLSKRCEEVTSELPSGEQIESSEEETLSEWKIVLIGYGCGVVIGFSIGYMLWPKMESLSLMMKFRDRVQQRKQVRRSKRGRKLQQGRR